jgi:hypothetical protein
LGNFTSREFIVVKERADAYCGYILCGVHDRRIEHDIKCASFIASAQPTKISIEEITSRKDQTLTSNAGTSKSQGRGKQELSRTSGPRFGKDLTWVHELCVLEEICAAGLNRPSLLYNAAARAYANTTTEEAGASNEVT